MAGSHSTAEQRTDAETIAQQAAEDAGWKIRWPRIRMMSQSPDLAPTTAASTTAGEAKQPSRTQKTSTWSQIRRFVGEITEVFGQSAAIAPGPTQLPLDEVTEQHVQSDQRVRSFISSGDVDRDDVDVAPARPHTRSQALTDFGRRHPLLALLLGWLLMLAVDWTVTSSVVPRLLSLLTMRPWSPFSEAFVMRASLIVDDDSGGAQVVRLLRRRLLRGELWFDEFLWSLQLFVCDTLVPMTRPYAMHWLCFSALSLKVLLRCSKVGARAVLLYAVYFALSDLVLWRILGSPALAPSVMANLYNAAPASPVLPFTCSRDSCVAAESQMLASDAETMVSAQLGANGVLQVPPHHVKSPFADAVEEALARKRAHVERRRERMNGLHEWKRRQQHQLGSYDSAGSRLLAVLATLAVYGYVAGRVHYLGVSAVHLCVMLLVLDVLSRASTHNACGGSALRAWESARSLTNSLSGISSVALCLGRRGAAAFPRVSGIGCLLPAHALSTFLVLGMRELAFVVHSMRVWYATTIRDRRRGPAMVSAQTARDNQNITLASALTAVAAPSDSENRCEPSADEQPVLTLSQVASRARAPYAHRVCFLCLSGFCERCLLSMNIWPTRLAEGDAVASGSAGTADTEQQHVAGDTAIGPTSPAHVRRKSRGHGRHHGSAKATDAAADSETGLPPLHETLMSLGLLGPVQTADAGAQHTAGGARRGKAVDMWIASSVAHCPCRAVHGVGPSSFVSRAAKLEFMHAEAGREGVEASEYEPPRGTLVPLTQYARELKSLGLVRPVDPASVVFGDDEDPASSVLPLIFGRFTMPTNPRAVAAANALLASSATSYAQLMEQQQQRASGHTPGSAPFLQQHKQPARILAKPTPLSLARAPTAGAFRLCAESTSLHDGVVRVYVVVTPTLAHLLLTHPRTSSTASVCVPASLASVMAARSRLSAAPPGISAATSRVADADPFLDHVRVQLVRSDIVVRVNGMRWADVDTSSLALLNQSIAIRGLYSNNVYRICVSVCGLRSEELVVVLPSIHAQVSRARLAEQLDIQAAQARRDDAICSKHDAAQRLKRTKRDAPRQVQHWRNELDSLQRGVDKHVQADARSRRRLSQLGEGIAALELKVAQLRSEHERGESQTVDSAKHDDGDLDLSDHDYDEEEEEQQPTVFDDRVGFNVLTRLNDADNARSTSSGSDHTRNPSDSSTIKRNDREPQTALSLLHSAEAEARRLRSTLEDRTQELKVQRSQWMSKLSRATQEHKPTRNAIAPLRSSLDDVARRLEAGKSGAERRRRQLQDLEQRLAESDRGDASERKSESEKAELIRSVAALRKSLRDEQLRMQQVSRSKFA
ncbi:hypothetical protein GGH12_001397 [Coemansia sp. RSA 1822]|nr:hypothetical protein LPJ76_001429 [Coemansia sp. RSA 638]KAJ2543920.1 hypothetical protein GGF49_001671 [Coemansia sp. RSA 1853]KAJ2565473.1 hypothetical protein GGH12_001397 [Coemansia sp. RSA 1822]